MNTRVKNSIIAIIAIGLMSLTIAISQRENDTTEPEPSSQQQTQEIDDSEADISQSENTSSPSESESEAAATVRYQNGQFTPQTVTVQQGDTVEFISPDDEDMWVGSDDHPTHTQYAGTTVSQHCQDGDEISRAFDQCSVGDTYTFTFEQTGEWDYHNHVNASAGGTIVVE